MKSYHPTIFIDHLRHEGRNNEVSELYDETDFNKLTWYFIVELFPKLEKLRKQGDLLSN